MNNSKKFDWNTVINEINNEVTLIPSGDYSFVVDDLQKTHFNGSQKLPDCNKVIISLKVETADGPKTIKTSILLCDCFNNTLCDFFTSIGLKKRGQPFVMDWDKVIGKEGCATIIQKEYIKKDGTVGKINDVKKFLDPVEVDEDNDEDDEDILPAFDDDDDMIPFA